MADIDIQNLTKVYDDESHDIVAVNDLDLKMEDGEFIVLVGPSGCGKSTTLRCIAGLEQPTSGDILLDGESMVGKRPSERDIAMVFQNYALYPHMSARENIAFGLEMGTDLDDNDIDRKVEEAAELLDITDHLDQKPGELSGGQQQRVALGRSIVREPQAFLLDEPLSNLDAKLRASMRAELQTLQQDLDVTTVYVTHDQTEAMTMGDRIAVLNGGELQQFGQPLELYDSPVNEFVAGFIGEPSMNFFEVRNGSGVLKNEWLNYRLSEELAAKLKDASNVLTVGIRPEDAVVLNEAYDVEPDLTSSARVVEPMGDVTLLYLEHQDMIVSVSDDRKFEENQVIPVQFPEEKLHLFDSNTGENVLLDEASIPENVESQVTRDAHS